MKLSLIAVSLIPLVADSFVVQPRFSPRSTSGVKVSVELSYKSDDTVDVVPSFVKSPVLQQVYPKLLQWKEQYGNPNIPLGTSEGRQCKTLRRLHIQKKLLDEEVTLLQELGFQFNDLEDVYFEADFDDMISRLQDYEKEHQDTYQVPKKYPPDPELGAWVTGLRRLSPSGVAPEHADRLNAMNFTWVSKRKCGSKFMQQYRALVERVKEGDGRGVLQEEATLEWIAAQQQARKRGTLSDTRFHYLQELIGEDWMEQ